MAEGQQYFVSIFDSANPTNLALTVLKRYFEENHPLTLPPGFWPAKNTLKKFKVVPIPMYRIFLNFVKSCILMSE